MKEKIKKITVGQLLGNIMAVMLIVSGIIMTPEYYLEMQRILVFYSIVGLFHFGLSDGILQYGIEKNGTSTQTLKYLPIVIITTIVGIVIFTMNSKYEIKTIIAFILRSF